MELRYKGSFKRNFNINNRTIVEEVYEAVINVKKASSIGQIHNLKKLRKYKTHYRIRVANDYRIGVIIKDNIVWFANFGHRSTFYKKFP